MPIACELAPPPRFSPNIGKSKPARRLPRLWIYDRQKYYPYPDLLRLATSRNFTSYKGAKRTRKSERSKLQRGRKVDLFRLKGFESYEKFTREKTIDTCCVVSQTVPLSSLVFVLNNQSTNGGGGRFLDYLPP